MVKKLNGGVKFDFLKYSMDDILLLKKKYGLLLQFFSKDKIPGIKQIRILILEMFFP